MLDDMEKGRSDRWLSKPHARAAGGTRRIRKGSGVVNVFDGTNPTLQKSEGGAPSVSFQLLH